MKNIKLVKFSNGKFGVRRGWIFYEYFDLKDTQYWWEKSSRHFPYCMVDIDIARHAFNMLTLTDEVIA